MLSFTRNIFIVFVSCLLCNTAMAQNFTASLTGNPINTTDWTFATGVSYVSGDVLVLTNPIGTQSGYVYYNTPVNLTPCAQFTVSFEFQVIPPTSGQVADGIAFWYISNPPTSFATGGGIGLPASPNGLILILDTYDNDGNSNTPLETLLGYNGTIAGYTEGSTAGVLGPVLTFQNFIDDGNWHSCSLTYNAGTVNAYFDGSTTASLTGTYPMNQVGYFGFSASTGAAYSTQSIRNVSITGFIPPLPPVVTPTVTYCQFDNATQLTAIGQNIEWYTTASGGTPLAAAPTPNTSVPGTTTWYIGQAFTPGGCESNRDSTVVTVTAKPAVPTVTGVQNYCGGGTFVPYTVTGQNVLWYTTAAGGVGDPVAPVTNTSAPGTYTYYVTQTVDGCESNRGIVTESVYDQVTASYTYQVHYGCKQDTVFFTNTSTLNNYKWDFGDGGVDTAVNPVHIFTVQALNSVKLTVRSSNCVDSMIQQIDLRHPLHALYTQDVDSVCQGGAVTFTNQSTATTPSYLWNFGDGNTSTDASPVHTFAEPGTFSVMLAATDFVPCYDTFYRTFVVDTLPSISFSSSTFVTCQGEAFHLDARYTQGGLVKTAWDFGDGTIIQSDGTIQHAYDQPGAYTITVIVSYRLCADVSATANISVNAYPVINLGPDTSMCPHDPPITITDFHNAGNGQAKWLWNTGDTISHITIDHYGIYEATVTINGCSNADSIEVRNDCYVSIPNVFTPNGDGTNDYFFPRQFLTSGALTFKMEIYNRWGVKIFETENLSGRGWDGKFNDQPQPDGVYIYLIDATLKDGENKHYQGNVTILR